MDARFPTNVLVCALISTITFATSSSHALTAQQILAQKGSGMDDLLAKPDFARLINKALIAEFAKSTRVSSGAKVVNGRFLVANGCEQHNCGDNRVVLIIDSRNPDAVAISRHQGDVDKQDAVFLRTPQWDDSDVETKFPQLKAELADPI